MNIHVLVFIHVLVLLVLLLVVHVVSYGGAWGLWHAFRKLEFLELHFWFHLIQHSSQRNIYITITGITTLQFGFWQWLAMIIIFVLLIKLIYFRNGVLVSIMSLAIQYNAIKAAENSWPIPRSPFKLPRTLQRCPRRGRARLYPTQSLISWLPVRSYEEIMMRYFLHLPNITWLGMLTVIPTLERQLMFTYRHVGESICLLRISMGKG